MKKLLAILRGWRVVVPAAHSAAIVYIVAVVSLFVSTTVGMLLGASHYSPLEILRDADVQRIVFHLRLPRVLFAVAIGGGLSVVGACYQSIFKNALASPFSLGVSSAAALGAALSLLGGTSSLLGGLGTPVSAIIGALVGLIAIIFCCRRDGGAERLLLVGVVFSFLCSSLLTLVQYLADYSQLFKVTRWLMGGVPVVSLVDVGVGFALVTVVMMWAQAHSRNFDLMLFGDDLARTKGVDTTLIRRTTFLITSVFVGWVVSQCGVIGFVGIIVPAVARLIVGISHRMLVPLSFLLGGTLVVLCDLLGRVVVPPFEVPAGVFTSLIGGPIFIALLLSRRKVTIADS